MQKLPGSHVIVSQAEGEADEETIRQAGALAATYSQAKSGGKVAVDCTQVRFVKKPSGAKPGRVIYTDYRTIITAADEALAERLRKDKDKDTKRPFATAKGRFVCRGECARVTAYARIPL